MLSLADYDSLYPTKVSRDQWIPRYRVRVPRSFTQFSRWSARKVSRTSVAEMDTDFQYRHLSRPKGYISPTVMAPKWPPPISEWTPRLACSVQIASLYAQEPWETATRRIASISFPRTGWFYQLTSLYLEFEDRNRQALRESTHAIFFSVNSGLAILSWTGGGNLGSSVDRELDTGGRQSFDSSRKI
uniref:Uncharacterized protein n=1 Tax=Peronospora matthiolae TaxID=2874970 RepID=A0AAV1TAB5_9STRA